MAALVASLGLLTAAPAGAKGRHRGPRGPGFIPPVLTVPTPPPGDVTFLDGTISVSSADASELNKVDPRLGRSIPPELLLGGFSRPHRKAGRESSAFKLELIDRVPGTPLKDLVKVSRVTFDPRTGQFRSELTLKLDARETIAFGAPAPASRRNACGVRITSLDSFYDSDTKDFPLGPNDVPVLLNGLGDWCFGHASQLPQASAKIDALGGGVSTLSSVPLTIEGTGAGTVTVTSSIPWLSGARSCAASCTLRYPFGATLTLTATAAAGSTFAGWGGVCGGTDPCSISLLGPPGSAGAVTATFNKTSASPTCTTTLTNQGTANEVVSNTQCPGTLPFDALQFTATQNNTITNFFPESGQASCSPTSTTVLVCHFPTLIATSGPIDIRFGSTEATSGPLLSVEASTNGGASWSVPWFGSLP